MAAASTSAEVVTSRSRSSSVASEAERQTRRQYSREKKLEILAYYYQTAKQNKYQTCQKFGINKKSLQRWISNEGKIQKGKKGAKRIGSGRRAFWPDVEEKLFEEFQEIRQKGLKVKHWWFRTRSKQLMEELHPEADFKFSPGWFDRFKSRVGISLRRSTNVSQKQPSNLEVAIREFHLNIRRVAAESQRKGELGQFELATIANVDQTPLPFCFSKGEGYDMTGAKTVWHRGGASGLEKRQCTAQLTIFADGEPRVKPLLIFRGKGLRIPQAETRAYDHRVVVKFQPNAWCDEEMMLHWCRHMWKRPFSIDFKKPKLLIADVHKAQTTDNVIAFLKRETTTSVVLVPAGCTSLVQPLDVSFNGVFKSVVERLQNDHMHQNLDKYVSGTIPAGQRRILFSKWVGEAWAEVSKNKEMIRRAFEKCGISVPFDGSKDEAIKIKGLDGYRVRLTDADDTDDDLFELDSDSEPEDSEPEDSEPED